MFNTLYELGLFSPLHAVFMTFFLFFRHALTELFFLLLVVLPFLNISWDSFLLRVLCIGLLSILCIFMPCPFGALALAFKPAIIVHGSVLFSTPFPSGYFFWGLFHMPSTSHIFILVGAFCWAHFFSECFSWGFFPYLNI